MKWADYDSRACSVARTVEVLGDRWTLLVLRDIFNGIRRFADLGAHLGVARDVLAKRLALLRGARDRVPDAPVGRAGAGCPGPHPLRLRLRERARAARRRLD